MYRYLKVLVRSSGVSGRIACCFLTNLHFADEPRTPKCPHYQLALKKTIWITGRRFYFWTRGTGTCLYTLQGFHYQRDRAVPILLLHALRFLIPKNHLDQWHHCCSNAESRPSPTNHPSLTMHHLPRCCRKPRLLETRMINNPRPVQIRTFRYHKRLLLR